MNPFRLHKQVDYFWKKEHGIIYMFILVLLNNFVLQQFYVTHPTMKLLVGLLWLIIFVSGINAVSKSRLQAVALSLFPFISVIAVILHINFNETFYTYLQFFSRISFLSILIWIFMVKVFEDGPVNIYRIIGAIVVYIFIGNLWGETYEFLYEQIPGAISLPPSTLADNTSTASFIYYSFSTLTTTGYGEFVPVHPIARSLATIEQLIGVLYPVILIGRLVSLEIEEKKKA